VTISFNAARVFLGATAVLVVSVRWRVIEDPYECDLVRLAFEHRYRMPVVLLAQDERGCPTYRGRTTLIALLRRIPVTSLPWRRIH
jgi:hypothetical protein